MSTFDGVGIEECCAVHTAVRRLEARGVERRKATRVVAQGNGTTIRYVRQRLSDPNARGASWRV